MFIMLPYLFSLVFLLATSLSTSSPFSKTNDHGTKKILHLSYKEPVVKHNIEKIPKDKLFRLKENNNEDTLDDLMRKKRFLSWFGRKEDPATTEVEQEMTYTTPSPLKEVTKKKKEKSSWRSWFSGGDSKNEEDSRTTDEPKTTESPREEVTTKKTKPKSSWKSWFSGIASKAKKKYSKVKEKVKFHASRLKNATKVKASKYGRKLMRGFYKIRRKFSRSDDKFALFANKVKKQVERGDEKAIHLLHNLGIEVQYADNGKLTGSTILEGADNVTDILKESGYLNPIEFGNETIAEPVTDTIKTIINTDSTRITSESVELETAETLPTKNESTKTTQYHLKTQPSTTEKSKTTVDDYTRITIGESTEMEVLGKTQTTLGAQKIPTSYDANYTRETEQTTTTMTKLYQSSTDSIRDLYSTDLTTDMTKELEDTVTTVEPTLENTNDTSATEPETIHPTSSATTLQTTALKTTRHISITTSKTTQTAATKAASPSTMSEIETIQPASSIVTTIQTTLKTTPHIPSTTSWTTQTNTTEIAGTSAISEPETTQPASSTTTAIQTTTHSPTTTSKTTQTTATKRAGTSTTSEPETTQLTSSTTLRTIPYIPTTTSQIIQTTTIIASTSTVSEPETTQSASSTTAAIQTTQHIPTTRIQTTQTETIKTTGTSSTSEPETTTHYHSDNENNKVTLEPPPFPDIFSESMVRDRLHDIFLNGDFSHDDFRSTFDFDPALYEDYYNYDY